jgi:hypothetical protein
MDSLRRRVLARDRQNNTDRQLEVTARDTTTTLICVACRKVPDALALKMAWNVAHPVTWNRPRESWPGLGGVCPSCGAQLAEVTW